MLATCVDNPWAFGMAVVQVVQAVALAVMADRSRRVRKVDRRAS